VAGRRARRCVRTLGAGGSAGRGARAARRAAAGRSSAGAEQHRGGGGRHAEAITDGIQDELRHRLFDAIWVRRQNLSSAYDVRRVVTAITWPAPPIYFHLASPELPLPLLHDPDAVRIVRRSGGTVTLDGGPLTSTGYRRCRDWQEWLALPRQVTPAVIGPDGTVHVGADGLRCLAAIMVAVGARPGQERVVQPGPDLG
jgi:hypothetical protein